MEELKSLIVSFGKDTENFKKSINLFNSNFTARNTFSFPQSLSCDSDYMDFASNLCEFVENNKIIEYQNRISERYVNIIRRISKETGELTQSESLINKTIKDINDDLSNVISQELSAVSNSGLCRVTTSLCSFL